MQPHVVVDIGNTRIKWGAVSPAGGIARTATLPDDPAIWQTQLAEWCQAGLIPGGQTSWVLASVQPRRCEHLQGWLEALGHRVVLLTKAAQLPLKVGLAEPDKAGIDRLIDAVAACKRLPPGRPAVLIDAGSAVTIDYLDENHVFQGGLIAPGLDLMARSLNSYTALLPLIDVTLPIPDLPAGRTTTAMHTGIFLSVSGCIREAVRVYHEKTTVKPRVFFTGGQSPLLIKGMNLTDEPPWHDWLLWPEQTLLGILYSVEALP